MGKMSILPIESLQIGYTIQKMQHGGMFEMIGFVIALLSGALMSVQGVFNTQVTKTTGMWVSNGWVQLSAGL